ncbi:hypothetical protein H8S17_07450 [Roseburia sp. BX1005]|uniref:AAA+ ATPase domain-containing protein n=2 Tax=Roseburia zhanii TaxID=2763064 RepID=A0A923LNA8_9FIRM|nr:hypothetical protein [Roseburia zhanii]
MKALAAEGDYATAAEIADTINWRRIKNINLLIKAGDVYTKQKRYEEARDILLMAYDRSPIGRMIIYRLSEIAIKMKNFEEAEEYYDEFVELAPHDNLRYVLRYRISKAKGADIHTLITILEELKESEYTEEWAYELAYLYHRAGEVEKCINACDELILWFGDGVYVERALELKMLYQPLTKSQEDKYRSFRQYRDGIKEIRPEADAPSVTIPLVQEDVEKYNTTNLQEELAKSMQQIMDATEKEAVDDAMDGIKKMVGEIPYLQVPADAKKEAEEEAAHMETEAKIDDALRVNFKEILSEDHDGQHNMNTEGDAQKPQLNGQMSIHDSLSGWKKKMHAAEAALQMADQQKLESAKARALQEAGDIMDRLADVMPKLENGMTPAEVLRKDYLESGEQISDEEGAGRLMEDVNHRLQQEIDRLQDETEHELLRKVKQAKPNFDEQIGLKPYVPREFERPQTAAESSGAPEEPVQPEGVVETEHALKVEHPVETEVSDKADPYLANEEEMQLAEAEFYGKTSAATDQPLPEIAMPEGMEDAAESPLMKQDTKEIKTDKVAEALVQQVMKLENEGEDPVAGERPAITKLSDAQKAIFSYFVPVDGMERQICQVLTGASARLSKCASSATGNILIQGGKGCGKTVLATGLIKALQKEVKRPNGKIGKIDAEALNKKDLSALLKKISGGCLIIERAGEIDRETAVKLSLLLETDTSGILVIMEDTRVGLNQAMGRDEGLAKKFTEKITIPVFTSDELVEFGKAYAHDLDYEIDNMGVLALYNRISNIQKLDRATTLTEVKEIVDEAIEKAEKKSLKKALSIITSRRYTEDDYVILREKDFEE